MHLRNNFRTSDLNTTKYKLFSEPHGTFSKLDHIIIHKASLNRCMKVEMMPCILSDYKGIKLYVNINRNK